MTDLTDMPNTAAEQVELFLVSVASAAELFVSHFQADVDKDEKALANAAAKLREAQHLRDVAEGNLRRVRRKVVPVVANDTDDATVGENKDTQAVVVVLWPGDPESHITEVGEETRYLELVADYYVATDGAYGELNEFSIWGEEDGAERRPEDTITPDDYGRHLIITKRQEATP